MAERHDTRRLAQSIFDRTREIKRRYPNVAGKINRLERDIRQRMEQIHEQVKLLPKEERDLVTIFIINGLQRTCEEVFIE
jgi:hypothetical protein